MTTIREMTHEMPMERAGGLVARYESALALADRIPLSLVQLAARVSVAHVFWQSAQSKLASWPVTLQLFAMEYRIPVLDPAVAAPLATAAEITGVGAAVLRPAVTARCADAAWRRRDDPDFRISRELGGAPAVGFAAAADLCARRWRHIARLHRAALVRSPGLTMLQQPISEAGVTPLPAGSPQAGAALVRRPHVVILGAGFGGLNAAIGLRKAPVDITVVDRRNYHLFQPLLYQVATAGLSPAQIAMPIRRILAGQKNATVLMEKVEAVDAAAQIVTTASRRIAYDFLVIATGARHAYFGHDEWEEAAPGLKTIGDATEIRARILAAFEKAEVTEDPELRRKLLTFVIVGGGPTGVELAGAIIELARKAISRDFRNIDSSTTQGRAGRGRRTAACYIP